MSAGIATRVAALGFAFLAVAATASARSPWKDGDAVAIGGRVTDAQGRPLGGVTVLLEVSRNAYSLRRLGREIKDTVTVPVVAGADGRFAVEWRWDRHYNTFWLAVAMPVQRDGRETFDVFDRVDATDNVDRGAPGTPIEVAVILPDGGAVGWLKRLLSGRASADEEKVYREMGRPDRVDEESDGGIERLAWWYFRAGRVYRFVDGRLDQVVPFDPVAPL